jgi:flagellin-like protein
MVRSNKLAKNDEAVSAVIGVILMVAITVILAAVIAAFVFGYGSDTKITYFDAAFAASRISANEVYVLNAGGNDNNELTSVAVIIDGITQTPLQTLSTSVGSNEVFTTAPATGSDSHVVVIGTFADQSSQVLLDTYV